MSSISEKHGEAIQVELRSWGDIKQGYTHFAEGDVVLAKITPCFENGKAAVITELKNERGIGAGTTELHVFRPIHPGIHPGYIYIFLRSPFFVVEGTRNMTGTAGQKRLPMDYFATRAMPLPPCAEQMRIVTKVDELMALCDKLEALQRDRDDLCKLTRYAVLDANAGALNSIETQYAWERLRDAWSHLIDNVDGVEDIKRVIFDLAISGKITKQNPIEDAESYLHSLKILKEQSLTEKKTRRPKYEPEAKPFYMLPINWQWSTLQSLSHDIYYGYTEKAIDREEGVRFLRITDIQDDFVNWKSVPSCDIDDKQYDKYKIENGDILIARTGGTIGKTYLVSGLNRRAVFASYLIKFAPLDSVNSSFVKLFMQSNLYWEQLVEASSGTGQPNVNATSLKALSIPIPPIEEQARIVASVRELIDICDIIKTKLTNSINLQDALAKACISQITGIHTEEKEKMKVPKTQLVSRLRIGTNPTTKEQAPLASILAHHNSEMEARDLWQRYGGEIDAFYRQLKAEVEKGWIAEPNVAEMLEAEAG